MYDRLVEKHAGDGVGDAAGLADGVGAGDAETVGATLLVIDAVAVAEAEGTIAHRPALELLAKQTAGSADAATIWPPDVQAEGSALPARFTIAALPGASIAAGKSARPLLLRSTYVSAELLRRRHDGRRSPTKRFSPIGSVANAGMPAKKPGSNPVTPAPKRSSVVRRVRLANVDALRKPRPAPPPGVDGPEPQAFGTWQESASDVSCEPAGGKSCAGSDVSAFSRVLDVPLMVTVCRSTFLQKRHGGRAAKAFELKSTLVSCNRPSKRPAGSAVRFLPERAMEDVLAQQPAQVTGAAVTLQQLGEDEHQPLDDDGDGEAVLENDAQLASSTLRMILL